MKILIVTERFAPDFAGGGELLTLETAQRLRAAGCEVRVLTTGDPAIAHYEGIPTERIPGGRYRFNLRSARAIAASAGVDLVHVFGLHACRPALAAARHHRLPILCTLSALFGEAWRTMKPPVAGRLWSMLERAIVRQPFDAVHLISDASRSLAIRLGVDPERCFVLHPGIHHEEFSPVWPKEKVVLFSGKLDVRKGLAELLDAAARLPQVAFRIVGWGPREAAFRARATPNVRFAAFVRGAEHREHFNRAAIFCMPSHVETFGFALVEAQAAGCAIISSVPLPFAGVAVPSRNSQALTAAIDRLWNDPVQTELDGRENLQIARRYNWDHYTGELIYRYKQLAAGRPSLEKRPSPDPVDL